MNKHNTILPVLAAYITWLVVFGLSMAQLWNREQLLEAAGLQLVVLVLLGLAVSRGLQEQKLPLGKAAMILMLLMLLILSLRIQIGFFFIYTVMWIAIAASYFSQRTCWLVLIFISLAWFVIRLVVWKEGDALFETLLVTTFHVFALMSALTAQAAELANQRTQELNRELLATQHLLGEASKTSERTRIARDLHDLLGHHLTALTINLQVAGRITEGEAKQKVDQCHALSKLLLSDVREAVSSLRDAPDVDLHELLSLAIKDIPKLQIDLIVDKKLKLDDVTIAEVLLRCVQEAITNSLRHSRAKSVQITVSENAGRLHMRILDDAAGVANIVPGNGLKGMRERIERLSGTLKLSSTPHLCIDIEIPLSVLQAGLQ